ncbi:putative bifunctional diguanylate cyclase/phosphodiesterase [Amphritea japonica]|uniref:cyclic-guanylate-specific phosphodiesterase n=1 Tax=Amphritea japonica ATCC BAA-1530 TaxID=1278309 RepID=A0A7R6SSN1_9GAMM|nr:EAL domain-containing response regulator [Amphritea japonica]BBB25815.1 two-component system response regulator [Amphritea japonica ATCC BAA-1530]
MNESNKLIANPNARSEFQNALIMMVDDEPIMMEIVQAHLEDAGYSEFISVEDSREAFDVLTHRRPDILFLDLVMPEVSGFDVLRRIRDYDEFAYLPVIVLTSSTDSASKLKALELGATDFLSKPVDASELKLRLRNTLTVKAYVDQLASSDALTGLPNRKSIHEKIIWSLKYDQMHSYKTALLNIGLDRFGEINESLGVHNGDLLLKQVAQRIRSVIDQRNKLLATNHRETELTIARLSGDEFGVLVPSFYQDEHAASLATQLRSELGKVYRIDNHDLYVSASIGIAVAPEDGLLSDDLIKAAGTAMRQAKQGGATNGFCFYSGTSSSDLQEKLELETDLHTALENDELMLFYQPKVDLITKQVTAAEALVRWNHPTKGFISPVQFIPLAEENGLILSIGDWVLNEACKQAEIWRRASMPDIKVSVNVSGQQFKEATYQARVQEALKNSELPPSLLMLEMTESLAMSDVESSIELFEGLKTLGVGLSIDDFGTGYSSLSYLKKFPLDELKVDRSFITGIPENKDEIQLVQAIIAMAKALRLSVVIEGVETAAQLNLLQATQSDLIQGFLFSKPLPADEFSEYVMSNVSQASF